jgi:hypothetical protein
MTGIYLPIILAVAAVLFIPVSVAAGDPGGAAGTITFDPANPVKLPAPRLKRGKPLMEALSLRQSEREFKSDALDLQTIGELCWAAWGLNRHKEGLRTAPSARNWQDMVLYVVLEQGVFVYDAQNHTLKAKVSGDKRAATGKQDFVAAAPLNFVYVSDFGKLSQTDASNRPVYSGAHAGFLSQNVYLYCASEGLATVVRAHFDADELGKALQLPEGYKPILAQTVGRK